MKKIIVLIVVLLNSIVSFGQDISVDKVPSVILNVFQQNFPKAVDVEWELDKKLYKVEFDIDQQEHEVWIDPDGNIVKQKQEISLQDLPKQVSASIATNYKEYRVDEIEKMITGTKTLYKVELKKGFKELDVWFDMQGKVIDSPRK